MHTQVHGQLRNFITMAAASQHETGTAVKALRLIPIGGAASKGLLEM